MFQPLLLCKGKRKGQQGSNDWRSKAELNIQTWQGLKRLVIQLIQLKHEHVRKTNASSGL